MADFVAPSTAAGRTGAPIGFAHRGGRSHGPANHLDTFRRAVAAGATGLESDVWVTADGVPVLTHDGVVGRRPIAQISSGELDDRVPSLRALLDLSPGLDVSLDVKAEEAAGPAIVVAGATGATERLWLCFGPASLAESWGPRWPRTVCSIRAKAIPDWGALVGGLAAAGVAALNLPAGDWTDQAVRQVHDAGLAAWGWHAHRRGVVRRLVARGVDAVFSDDVPMMMSELRGH